MLGNIVLEMSNRLILNTAKHVPSGASIEPHNGADKWWEIQSKKEKAVLWLSKLQNTCFHYWLLGIRRSQITSKNYLVYVWTVTTHHGMELDSARLQLLHSLNHRAQLNSFKTKPLYPDMRLVKQSRRWYLWYSRSACVPGSPVCFIGDSLLISKLVCTLSWMVNRKPKFVQSKWSASCKIHIWYQVFFLPKLSHGRKR